MADILKTITELPVADIRFGDRLRPVSEAGVAALMASIGDLGVMKDPIHVRKVKHRGGEYVLMAGAHRLTAAQKLGWTSIKVTCWDCNDDFADLLEIDDNLAGAELTPLDTAVFLSERKRIYENLHPEATWGGDRGNQHTTGRQTDTMSFCQTTAEKFGLTDRHIRRMVSAGDALSKADVQNLRAAPKPVFLKDIMEIAKIPDAPERDRVIALLCDGKAKNASSARKIWMLETHGGPSPLSNDDQHFARLKDAWSRATKTARTRFLEDCGGDVATHLKSLSDAAHDAPQEVTESNVIPVFQRRAEQA